MVMEEDIKILKNFICQVRDRVSIIKTEADKRKCSSVFTIGTTSKKNSNNGLPYLTPIRRAKNYICSGVIVYSQTQAILCAVESDELIDLVLVDAEKKLDILFRKSLILEDFGVKILNDKNTSEYEVELGNLSAACFPYIKKSHFLEFKGNDLTVNAAWHQLSQIFKIFSGKKIAIIGCGNIGFKLALILVESGASVELVRRDITRGMQMANMINLVKSDSTVARAYFNANPLQACLFADGVLGCTNGTTAVDKKMVLAMKKDGVLMDIGKGSLGKEAISQAITRGISVLRCDVTSSLDGLINTKLKTRHELNNITGRKEWSGGVFTVSGGKLGLDGDFVVDNYLNPTDVFGIADGNGDLAPVKTEDRHRILKLIK